MSLQRYAMAVRLKDEKKDFYLKNHQNVWPEILEELKKIKVKNYSIFLKEDFMFGYLEYEGDNFDKDLAQMSKIAIVDKWTKLMIDCFNPFPNNENNNSWVMMDQIFFMEESLNECSSYWWFRFYRLKGCFTIVKKKHFCNCCRRRY
jgi:L-rhamnose mutarotase